MASGLHPRQTPLNTPPGQAEQHNVDASRRCHPFPVNNSVMKIPAELLLDSVNLIELKSSQHDPRREIAVMRGDPDEIEGIPFSCPCSSAVLFFFFFFVWNNVYFVMCVLE